MEVWTLILSIIGALAWFPIIFSFIETMCRKIHYVYLDRHFVYNADATFYNNGKETKKQGMIFIVAVNLFVYKKSYFPREIVCHLKTKNGTVSHARLYEGQIGYNDTAKPSMDHIFNFPCEYNANIHRSIDSNINNTKIMPFFFEGLNFKNDENIECITIEFKGEKLSKKITITNEKCMKMNFIHKYDFVIGPHKGE